MQCNPIPRKTNLGRKLINKSLSFNLGYISPASILYSFSDLKCENSKHLRICPLAHIEGGKL